MPHYDDLSVARHLVIDPKNRVFILNVGFNTEAISFADVLDITNAIAGIAEKPSLAISAKDVGTTEAFERYRAALKLAPESFKAPMWFHSRTPHEVRSALLSAKACGRKIRIYYGDPLTGEDSLASRENIGWVGRMTGAHLPFPVLLNSLESRGGTRVFDSGIVRIQDLDASGLEVYKHPSYHLPQMSIAEITDGTVILSLKDRRIQFNTDDHYQRWRRYMMGVQHNTPRVPACV